MAHVDALSRNLEMEEIDVTDLTEADWIKVAQMQDERISRIKVFLEKKEQFSVYKQCFKDYLLREGSYIKSCKINEQLGLSLKV